MTSLFRSTALCFTLAGALVTAADLYVAPAGNDANPGTAEQPFATVQKARDAVRALKQAGPLPAGGVTVWLQAGTYTLSASLTLTAEDSGTVEAPIVYRAVKGADVWLSGAVGLAPDRFSPVADPEVLKLLPEEARLNVVQADLKAAGVPEDVKELPDKFSGFTGVDPLLLQVLCNGQWMTCARWPNESEGFAKFEEIVDTGSGLRDFVAQQEKKFRPGVFRYAGDRPARWNVDRGVWMLGYWARAYVCDVVRAGKIDPEKHEITWKVPLGFGLDTWGAGRWFAFNLIEELDTPGEYYVDRAKGMLYFWPPQPIERCAVAVAGLTEPMLVCDKAENITFDGIGFEGGRQDGVVVKGGANVCLRACEIRSVGRNAVQLTGGKGHKVLGCDIHHVGYSGVIMSGGDRKTLDPAGFEVVNNHISYTNRVKRTHASPVNMNGVGMRLANNLIHHAPHSAVFYGGNDLIMEYNDIYWCHYETAEGGVFYAGYNWTFRGDEIRYNYIHHINDSLAGSPTDVRTVHLDDCVAGTTFRGNVLFRAGNGVAICGGPFNVVDNNLFIDCQVGVDLEIRGLQWWTWTKNPDGTVTGRDTRASHGFTTNNGLLNSLKAVPWDKAPYTKYPHMAELLSVDDIGAPWWCAITRNISINGTVKRVDRRVKPEWAVIEKNWNGPDDGDPGVVAPYDGDYRLKPDAPALARTGFEPIPFERIGLINDDTRRSWPVQAEPPPKDFMPAWLVQREMEKKMPLGLPVVVVRRAPAAVTVDGAIAEWTSGEAYRAETLEGTATGEKAKLPSSAWLGVDDSCLYVVFDNPVDPKDGVKGGHTWGQSDAVEVALSVVEANEPGPILIWRGYTDGHFETSDEAGAPKAKVEAALKDVRYACKLVASDRWTAEFAIPFAAIGIEPKEVNPRLLFSLAVRKVNGDLWVTWKKAPGGSWDVRRGGVLWLEPFGNIALSSAMPSQGNIHIISKLGKDAPVLMNAIKGCEVASWENPVGSRLTAATADLPADRWTPFSLEFTPESDGEVLLMIMGRGFRSTVTNLLVPVWTYTDSVQVDGAELVNGGFEELDPKGMPTGWAPSGAPLVIRDAKVAADGTCCVKTWHDGRMTQRLKVTAGKSVTIKCQVKGEPVAGGK